ncbi:hypothetical protein OOJ09_06840 [Mesorhizobium qingshengii]|uniref:Transposase n=1 Tax=Mesorhizobium qingshengii TaxID=1165689 RepID=A0ABT4QQP0_9HYPH|nr:hypothetical protein [Mesorhizobium qingshengii]MCZ8543887.1 hypothetical protein [Mesorhizobium qingshengii]
MDSLKIQDAFTPYYAGRKRFAAPKDRRLPAKTETSLTNELAASAVPADIRLFDTEPDSTTEH